MCFQLGLMRLGGNVPVGGNGASSEVIRQHISDIGMTFCNDDNEEDEEPHRFHLHRSGRE